MRAALYARVSTHDQQTLGLQTEAMAAYIKNRGWVDGSAGAGVAPGGGPPP